MAADSDPKKFLLRLPPKLFDELRRWAEQDMRSINGQIEFLLRDAVRRRTGSDGDGAPKKKPRKKRGSNQ